MTHLEFLTLFGSSTTVGQESVSNSQPQPTSKRYSQANLTMKLTDNDIKKIRYEKRMAFIFSGLLLCFGGLFNIAYILSNKDRNWTILFLVNIFLLGLCALIVRLMNRKYNKDLNDGLKIKKLEKLERKESITSYEAGSGTLHSPILGALFPKIWGQKMKPNQKYILVVNNYEYEVEKEIFEKVTENEFVEMLYAKHSEILLGIEIHKDKE